MSSVLPTPVGPRNRNEPSGRLGSCKPGAGAADGGGHGLHRIFLADHPGTDRAFHLEQLLALAFHHPLDRNSGPAADDAGDVLVGHFLAQHRALGRGLRIDQLLFELGDAAVLELARLREVARALRLLKLEPRGIELLLDLGFAGDLFLFRLPALGELGRLLLEVGKLFLELRESVLRRLVLLLLQRLALDLQLDDPSIEILDLLGLAFRPPSGCGSRPRP